VVVLVVLGGCCRCCAPVEVCEALDVQHVDLVNEQHTRHQLSNTCQRNTQDQSGVVLSLDRPQPDVSSAWALKARASPFVGIGKHASFTGVL